MAARPKTARARSTYSASAPLRTGSRWPSRRSAVSRRTIREDGLYVRVCGTPTRETSSSGVTRMPALVVANRSGSASSGVT